MLGVIRLGAVLMGLAAGSLTSAAVYLIGLVITQGESTVPADHRPSAGAVLTLALLTGIAAGGALAGRLAPVNGRFHGSVTGLGMAGLVIVIARFSGSPAPASQVLLLAVIAALVGGAAGWWGGRHR